MRKRTPMLACLCAMAIAALARADVDVNSLPQPTGYVSDLAHVVSPEQKDQLEVLCTRVEQELGVQFALVTINSLGDQPIRDWALDLFRKWGVGSRKTNQGVLLLLVIQDRKSDIETGRGIEPYITDGFAGGTLRSMRPELRASDYGAALILGAQAMAQQIAQGKGVAFSAATPMPERRPVETEEHHRGIPFPLIILGIFLVLALLRRGGRGGGGGGFWTGLLLGNLLGGGRGGWGGGGGWGDGGGFGGGSGGGGGFGGFGGGDAGGGGASSNW